MDMKNHIEYLKDKVDDILTEDDLIVLMNERGGLWELHWRVRDEYLLRDNENRTGGYFHANDSFSKMTMHQLKRLATEISRYRLMFEDHADT